MNISTYFPDFLIVGAAKSGTSSLHYYLQNHPDVFMPQRIKELNFLHTYGYEKEAAILKREPSMPQNPMAYAGHFYEAAPEQIKGEASPSYLIYYERTIANIKKFYEGRALPKIIIILREPINKIWSHHKFNLQYQLDPDNLSLKEAIAAEPERLKDASYLPDVHYISNTQYYRQVKAYLEAFESVKVVLFDDLKQRPVELLYELHDFLGVERQLPEGLEVKHNPSKPVIVPPKPWVRWAMQLKLTRLPIPFKAYWRDKLLKKKEMDPEVRQALIRLFKPEVEQLQELLGQDLSNWLAQYHEEKVEA